ncbi:UDP-galactose transporter, putative [Babesia bigemina]|uniref:UDP-galactose transporter, putative n=1 Tax=Babesia bigemina TaxID=5866 RepID=A0A061D3Q7_BABBI|nr:UDP-galactose transporter, putative [Babesia bigemina]CDR94702.1 UDP-galactose transporter, putative [Babesia bigemina]|eukprot:XP_012766888.1 UDP-galactose transporter, putative [Babesia bigemina]
MVSRGNASHEDDGHYDAGDAQLDSNTARYRGSEKKGKMRIVIEDGATKADVRRKMVKDAGMAVMLFGLVCACYITYSYLQELMMRIPLMGDKKFDYPVFLAFTCFTTNLVTTSVLMGSMQLRLNWRRRKMGDSADGPKSVFEDFDKKVACLGMLAATSNVMSMLSALASIKYVGIPTQIVIKSAKMIPVLIGGFLIFGRRYPVYDYIAVFVITLCVFGFNYFKPKGRMDGENTLVGMLMCFFSLFCDGLTGPLEDKMLATKDLHPFMLLFSLNFFGFPMATAAVFVFEGTTPFKLLMQNPQIWMYLALLSLTASIGQVFIVICLKLYGSLYTTLITTIRKVASSLISIFMFNHYMSVMQWISMSGTFATLFIRQFFKYKMNTKNRSSNGDGH